MGIDFHFQVLKFTLWNLAPFKKNDCFKTLWRVTGFWCRKNTTIVASPSDFEKMLLNRNSLQGDRGKLISIANVF